MEGNMLTDHTSRMTRFYNSYPNLHGENDYIKQSCNVKGYFNDLAYYKGISMDKGSMKDINTLFKLDTVEEKELGYLSHNASINGTNDKKYTHLSIFFQLAYSICLESEPNLSFHASCEWQTNRRC